MNFELDDFVFFDMGGVEFYGHIVELDAEKALIAVPNFGKYRVPLKYLKKDL